MMTDANLMDLEGEAWAACDNLPNDLEGEKNEKNDDVLEGPVCGGDKGVWRRWLGEGEGKGELDCIVWFLFLNMYRRDGSLRRPIYCIMQNGFAKNVRRSVKLQVASWGQAGTQEALGGGGWKRLFF
jgi:hypothetical protein